TLTPLFSIPSAIVWNWLVSPCAFWMSNFTPACLNAAVRLGRSWVSYRAEDLVSGRMTPMYGCLPPAVADGLLDDDELLFELLQPATPVTTSATAVAAAMIPLRMTRPSV